MGVESVGKFVADVYCCHVVTLGNFLAGVEDHVSVKDGDVG